MKPAVPSPAPGDFSTLLAFVAGALVASVGFLLALAGGAP